MKRIGTTSLFLFCVLVWISGQVPVWDWATALHSPDYEFATDLAVHPSTGDVLLVGEWTGSLAASIPAGGSESTDFTDTYGGADGFVVKLDRNGNFQWAFKMGGEGDDRISAVHMDSDGNFYITGFIGPGDVRFSGTGSLIADSVYTNSRSKAFYLVKYDSEGKLIWARYSTGNAQAEGFGISSNSSGVFVTGYFKNSLILGPLSRNSSGDESIFLVKYTPDGNEEWLIHGSSWDWDYGRDVVCDDVNIYITGEFYGDQLGMSNVAGDIVTTLPNSTDGKSEIFISCYSNAGDHHWSSWVASLEDDFGHGITMDMDSVYLTGSIGAPASFPFYAGNPTAHTGNQDAFVCALSRIDGSTGWVRTLTGISGDDQVSSDISIDLDGNLYITGYYQSEIQAGPDTESNRGNEDIFVASYTTDGDYRWLLSAGSSNEDYGEAVSGLYPGSVFVAGGYSSNSASFGAINLPADGNQNAFVGRLQLPCTDALGGTLSASDTAFCEGEELTLAIEGHSGNMQWQSSPPGMNAWSLLSADQSDSIVFTPLSSADYRVRVISDPCEADSSNIIHVRVVPFPLVDAGSDVTINVGDTIQLNGSGGDSLRWTPDTRLSDPAIPNPFASPGVTTTYYLTAMAPLECSAMDSVIVTVISCIDAVGGTLTASDTAVCEGEILSLAINDHFGQVHWQSSPPGMNAWSMLTNDLADSIAFIPLFSADYRVLMTSDTCATDSSNVVYVGLVQTSMVDAGSPVTIDAGDTIQLNGSTGDSVRWTPDYRLSDPTLPGPFADPWVTTTYYQTVFVSMGCSGTDSVRITVLPPDFARAGSDQTICQGDSVRLLASGGDSYAWEPYGSLDRNDVPDPWARPQLTSSYVVHVTSSIGLVDSDTVTVFVNPSPVITTSPDISVCRGTEVELSATGTGGFTWSPQVPVTDATQVNSMALVDSTTTFMVVFTDLNGCRDSSQITVTVFDPPIANAGPDQEIIDIYETYLGASLGTGETGTWSLVSGYGIIMDHNDPESRIIELEIGDNVFEWRVTNSVCPIASDQVNIRVKEFVIPTVITPNEDGKNDLFHVEGIENYPSSELLVLDRWGVVVYTAAPYLNNWNGTDQNGNELQEETYYIVLTIRDEDIRKGYVMILR